MIFIKYTKNELSKRDLIVDVLPFATRSDSY